MIKITSTTNAQIRVLLQLQKKAKVRKEQDVFLVEGIKMFREAVPEHLRQIYASESFYEKNKTEFTADREEKTILLSDAVFALVSDTKTPQGVLCVVKQQHYSLQQLIKRKNPLIMILENIQDPGNLGTILRTAEGAGACGIILTQDCVDLYNPKVIRSTMGSVYRMPFLVTDDLKKTAEELKSAGVKICAAHLQGSVSYLEQTYTGACAFLIGNESKGLTAQAAALADCCIRIPMEGKVESLNAGIASAILMYEAARQRKGTAEK